MSTATRELSVNKLLELAAKTAGIMSMEQVAEGSQWNARASYGRDQLELIMDALQADGLTVRDVEVMRVTIVAGTSDYTLASDTIDVHGNGMYRKAGEDSGSPVRQVDREEFVGTPDRTVEAMPTRFYVERGASVKVRLLDVPDAAGTLEISRQRLLADNTDGNATVDLERHWIDYLHHELAARFAAAASLPSSKIAELRKVSDDKKKIAQSKAKQNVANVIELDHPTGWS